MENYVATYSGSYDKIRTLAIEFLFKRITVYRNLGWNYRRAIAELNNDFWNARKKLSINQKSYTNIIERFEHRTALYLEGLENNIISDELKKIYEEIPENKETISFNQIVIQLGINESYKDVLLDFEERESIFINIYNVGTFNLMEIHSVINSPIIPTKKNINNFKISSDHDKCFLKPELYYKLIKLYVDEFKTTAENFSNVFLKDFNSHDSIVHFSCSTQEASYLLKLFKQKFSKKLTATNIERSAKFKTINDEYLTASNISTSINDCRETLKEQVKFNFNEYLSSIKC